MSLVTLDSTAATPRPDRKSRHLRFTERLQADGTPSDPVDPLNQKGIERIVALAVETLDPGDALGRYSRLGAEVLHLAERQKSDAPCWEKEDFRRLTDEIRRRVEELLPIEHVELDKYVRIHLWVEAVRPLVPGVDGLSFFQVVNKFLPTLRFDPADLTGEIKSGWLTWVRSTVERQLGDDPLSMKALDQAIADQKEAIASEVAPSRRPPTPERKAKAARRSALAKVTEAIDLAMAKGGLDGADIMQIAEAVAKERHVTLPRLGFDPADLTDSDCCRIAKLMHSSGKLGEMATLRDQLDAYILTSSSPGARLRA